MKAGEQQKEELVQKVFGVEEVIYEKYKIDGPYTNRVLEILNNIKDKDKNNIEFREGIVKGNILPEKFATIDKL